MGPRKREQTEWVSRTSWSTKKMKEKRNTKREWHKVCHKQKNPSSAYAVFRLKLCTLQGLRCVILPDQAEKATSEAVYLAPKHVQLIY